MMPINTFSSEILRKLHKSDKIGNLNSDQFLLSLLSMPDMWMRVPFIALSNKELANYYDLTDGECAYLQAFDNKGNCNRNWRKPTTRCLPNGPVSTRTC